MPTNWKSLVEKQNASTFVLPDGWDSKADIALQLECSEEKVDDYLRPALKSGKVLKQTFRVWDAQLKRVLITVAYHDTSKDAKVASEAPTVTLSEITRLKHEGKSWAEVGRAFSISGEQARSIYRRNK